MVDPHILWRLRTTRPNGWIKQEHLGKTKRFKRFHDIPDQEIQSKFYTYPQGCFQTDQSAYFTWFKFKTGQKYAPSALALREPPFDSSLTLFLGPSVAGRQALILSWRISVCMALGLICQKMKLVGDWQPACLRRAGSEGAPAWGPDRWKFKSNF